MTLKHDNSENITNKTKEKESTLLFYLSAFSTVMLIRNSHNLFSGKKTKQKKQSLAQKSLAQMQILGQWCPNFYFLKGARS